MDNDQQLNNLYNNPKPMLKHAKFIVKKYFESLDEPYSKDYTEMSSSSTSSQLSHGIFFILRF